MKRQLLRALLVAALLCAAVLLAHPSAAWAMEGTGSKDDPYQISSAADLKAFAELVNSGQTGACAVLTENITINKDVLNEENGTLNGDGTGFEPWTPIGDSNNRYSGTFDGAGHTISGLYIDDSDADYVGLFGYIGENGMVKDLTLADSSIKGGSGVVGGICGLNNGGCIEDCSNSGDVSGSSSYVGGICGDSGGSITGCSNSGTVSGSGIYVGGICGAGNGGWIEDCSNSGDVSGSGVVGGICGLNNGGCIEDCSNSGDVSGSYVGGICGHSSGSITGCSNSGDVSGSGSYVGGICGVNSSIISNCSNSGDVSGSGSTVGGICGVNSDPGTISNCSNSGTVTGGSNVGGICGMNEWGSISNCYWLKLEGSASAGVGSGSGTVEKVEEKTDAQFASGEVAWRLNGSSTNGSWRQNLGEDDYPTLDETHGIVVPKGTNDYENITYDENGFGKYDGETYYQPATKISGIYQIENAGNLYWFAGLVNNGQTGACAVLTENITLDKNEQWTPIGGELNQYTGTFDGAGHTISGLYFNDNSADYVGLFGAIGRGGMVKDLTLADSFITGANYVGGICGWNDGRIENCSNSGDVSDSGFNSEVGGICGENRGSITNCSNSGNVSGSGSDVGGICGYNSFEGSITNCYWLSGTAGAGIGGGSVSGEATEKTEDEYKSGEVAWLLNQGQTDGPWRQNLGEGGDSVPILDSTHKVVVQLIFNANTGNTADNRYQYANSGDTVSVPEAPGYQGHTFVGWYNNKNCTGETVTTITATDIGNQEYWAQWTVNTYTVNLNANGGTIAGGKDVTNYTYGTATALPTAQDITRAGYTFGGWYDNEALSGEPETVIPADAMGAKEYWAKWTAKSYPSTPSVIPPTVSEETSDAIADAQPGETVTVDLSGGSTKLDKDVFETLAGRDVTLVVELGDGVSWTVNGSDISEDADFTDIDMGVTMNSDGIPVDVVNAITGERSSVQITLAHDGAFGFTMTLTTPLGAENAGCWANLYHFDEEANAMTFETAAPIGSDGSVSLAFSHASQYAIVIDDHNHGIVTLPFTDVSEGDWFYNPVCYVYSQGLMTGTTATTFEPNTPLSRAMLVAVLHRLEGSPAASGSDFSDVASGDWYAQAVNWAASVGVVNGMGDGSFQPNAAITREQMAAILRNYAAYKGLDVTATGSLANYSDAASVSDWAKESIQWAVVSGLIGGYEDDTLRPQGTTTRAEVASVLQRYLAN